MLITRTPLRITLGGGGTDLPSYYEKRGGGMVLSAAITKHVYISVNRTFTGDYFLKYSALERVDRVEEIDHSIFREVLSAHGVGPGVEMVSTADIPAGTGLGSSGSFTVGLLRAVHAAQRKHVGAADLAAQACEIEIDRLGRAVGKQDQYIAAYGGITQFEFRADGTVDVATGVMDDDTAHELEEHLLMFFTGYSRDADQMLKDQRSLSLADDADMAANLDTVKELGYRSLDALRAGRTGEFADIMHEHWLHKRKRSGDMSNPRIDRLYDLALDHGARGGKLVGAGGGGFLMFYAEDTKALRAAMKAEGLHELKFGFDHQGSTVMVQD